MARLKRFLLVAVIGAAIFTYLLGHLEGGITLGLIIGMFSLFLRTKEERDADKAYEKAKKEERQREEEARKREEEAKERARKAPGCHSMDNVDILTFSSHNNILTAGNNFITMRIRNRNPYDVIVSISFKYSDSDGWDSSTKSYEVGGNKIRTIDTHGDAWHRAKDVTIVAVH